jgi:energy-coupling factor transporter ATP-binding protein EcfA2
MHPEILVLDEPTSELDPIGKSEVFSIVSDLRRQSDITIVLVEHETEEIARYADRVVLIDEGEIRVDKSPKDFFSNVADLKKMGVDPPQVTELTSLLIQNGIFRGEPAVTVEEAFKISSSILKKRRSPQ